jgi:pimeloyl-ACP methyl ester carboxylesterase
VSDGLRALRQSGRGPIVADITGAGPPLILLHGLAGSARWWKRNTPALARSFRVMAIDLPGFGRSQRDARFVLEDAPSQLVRAMDRMGIERANFIGHSMGGLVAGGVAADHPDRVSRLVLVDAGFTSLDPSLGHRVRGILATMRWTSPALVPVFLEDSLRSGPVRLAAATVQLLQADWGSKLPLIRASTLVIWGEHDAICPLTIGQQIAKRIPDARLVVIKRAAHSPMWERSETFDSEVLAFLTTGLSDPAPHSTSVHEFRS